MQLHPHFLFNTLNAISTLVHKDPEAADRMIARLSELLRLTLENVGVQEVPLAQELEFLERYLEIEKTRFADRLIVRMDIAPEALDAFTPYLILQPLVENAIRHGIAARSLVGRIVISAKRCDNMLVVKVSDNGPGMAGAAAVGRKDGVGISTTRARLEKLYGAEQRFEFFDAEDGGLVAMLTFPFRAMSKSPAPPERDTDTLKIRALIVDDEPLGRERIRTLLREDAEVDVVGEAGNGHEAAIEIERLRPDLLFLDVQMPEMDGFAVLDAIADKHMPVIIFVTAYDRYAVQAFEVHALDYLLKAFDRERFESAVSRAKEEVRRSKEGIFNERLVTLLEDLESRKERSTRLVIKSSGRIFFLPVKEIDWVEAADNYIRIHAGGKEHLMRETLQSLEGRLDPERFLRVHRSAIVNIDRIRELQPMFHGDYALRLCDGTELTLSRKYKDKLGESLARFI